MSLIQMRYNVKNLEKIIQNIVTELTDETPVKDFYPVQPTSLPSVEMVKEITTIAQKIFFPGFYTEHRSDNLFNGFNTGSLLFKISDLLKDQCLKSLCFTCTKQSVDHCRDCDSKATDIVEKFISTLPEVRKKLYSDIRALYDGDPAAASYAEIIYCYPAVTAMLNHRLAHELFRLEVPILPRLMSELAHQVTGIDIHPGATIGEALAIDHGTGVVIGETCIIGKNVKIYQGVTLGAKSFTLDEHGLPVKGVPRHPIVEDGVVIYANATVLGRITIGKNSVIGGNVWLTNSVPEESVVKK